MAKHKNTNPRPVVHTQAQIPPQADVLPDAAAAPTQSPDVLITPEQKLAKRFFFKSGTAANVALAETSLLANRDESLFIETINELDASAMYKLLIDEQYENQDDNSMDDLVNTTNYSILELHARLFIAGRIAERADQRRLRRQNKFAAHVLRVQLGQEVLPTDLKEVLP